MANKKNAYLEKKRAEKEAFMNRVQSVVVQYCVDTMIITLNDKEGWGYDRLMRLMRDWHDTMVEYADSINPSMSVEADVQQEKIDRLLVQIIRGKQKLIPFAERYPTLAKIKY